MLDRESACNRVFLARRFVRFGADGVGLRFEPCSFVFQAGRCPQIDNVVTAALLPHQPDELRRRRDRYDNGERATPLDVPATQWNQAKFFNDFSRACARVRARRGGFGVGAGAPGDRAVCARSREARFPVLAAGRSRGFLAEAVQRRHHDDITALARAHPVPSVKPDSLSLRW